MIAKDPNLPHQICLTFAKHTGQSSIPVVTCNCWKANHSATAFERHFGDAPTLPDAWRLYLDPANHRGRTPFVPDPKLVAKYVI